MGYCNVCWESCMPWRLRSRPVACAFLAARIQSEKTPVRLSCYVYSARRVRDLLALAREARHQFGLQDALPPPVPVAANDSGPTPASAVLGAGHDASNLIET